MSNASFIYRLMSRAEWEAARERGCFEGSADDRRDGFIHFSAADQVAGTFARHYAARSDLMVLAVPTDTLGEALVWEPSRGGALFPHLYGVLPVERVAWAAPLRLDEAGRPVLDAPQAQDGEGGA